MTDDTDYDPGLANIADERSGMMRFLPMMVVGVAITGFFVLAWYAYHAGTKSVKEEDLLLVEADDNPFKEAPADPGGMKFPHQDKTIFEAISGESNKNPQVERVLPAPEEPMEKPGSDEGDTKSWVNESLRSEKSVEELTKPDAKAAADALEADRSAAPVMTAPLKKAEPKVAAPVMKEMPKEEPKPVVKEAPQEEAKPLAKATPAFTPSSGSGKIQLAAFRDEDEALKQWEKIQAKHTALLGGYEPSVQRADLGSKGIFFRLQVHGVGNPSDLCAQLKSAGQACIIASGK